MFYIDISINMDIYLVYYILGNDKVNVNDSRKIIV